MFLASARFLTLNVDEHAMAKKQRNKNPSNKQCEIFTCPDAFYAHGLCNRHYKRKLEGRPLIDRHFREDYSSHPSEPCENAVCLPLTKGFHTLIDAEDFDRIGMRMWSTSMSADGSPYAVQHPNIRLHRLITSAEKLDVDHINRDTLNNRKHNLRLCTDRENQGNRIKGGLGETSQYKGVFYSKGHNRWMAACKRIDGKRITKSCRTEDEAAKAYDLMAVEFFGEFARLNFPKQGDV